MDFVQFVPPSVYRSHSPSGGAHTMRVGVLRRQPSWNGPSGEDDTACMSSESLSHDKRACQVSRSPTCRSNSRGEEVEGAILVQERVPAPACQGLVHVGGLAALEVERRRATVPNEVAVLRVRAKLRRPAGPGTMKGLGLLLPPPTSQKTGHVIPHPDHAVNRTRATITAESDAAPSRPVGRTRLLPPPSQPLCLRSAGAVLLQPAQPHRPMHLVG